MQRKFGENCTSSLMDCDWIPKLLLATTKFNGHSLSEWNVVESKTDFGFMSSIYEAQLFTTTGVDDIDHRYDLIIKVMKGSEEFRLSSQSYLQFQNEIYFYDKIWPHFNSYLLGKTNDVIDLSQWIPKTYLSIKQNDETVLVQENIQKAGFNVEPTLYLTEEHLNLMVDCLAQFHAVSLAQKMENGQEFMQLVDKIQPLCFEQPNGLPSLYDVLHEISTTRLFEYAFCGERGGKFIDNMNQLQKVIGDKPVKLLDRFREVDDFAVIVHGDYHRNNVLFRKINNNCVADMKMIDFQQIRYGSPCLDLSFFMYLNISADSRGSLWNRIIQKYHQQLVKHTAGILRISINDPTLTCYSYEKFLQHCQRFFLYGALISASFTPWLLTTQSETEKVVNLFQTNMFDQEYRQFALVVGGEAANSRVLGNMVHASEQGYMEMLYVVETIDVSTLVKECEKESFIG